MFDVKRDPEAKSLCLANGGCPVIDQCAKLGEFESYGTWGGRTMIERARDLWMEYDRQNRPRMLRGILVRLLHTGYPIDQVSITFGLDITVVRQARDGAPDSEGVLTPQQSEVLTKLRLGQSVQEIAQDLGVKPESVQTLITRTNLRQFLEGEGGSQIEGCYPDPMNMRVPLKKSVLIDEKCCRRCGVTKPTVEFAKRGPNLGVNSWCKDCHRQYKLERKARVGHE